MASGIIALVLGYLFYRRYPSNPVRRSSILYSMLFSSIFIWVQLGVSLVLCTVFLNQYVDGQDWILQLVFGSSLLASLGVSGIMTFVARRFVLPRALKDMTADSPQVGYLEELFYSLARKMGISAGLAEAVGGNAFSLSVGGRNLVAVSSDMVQHLSTEETEAVLAHELSHIKNRDSLVKGLARLAHLAFPFDPVIRLVEAAVHRERELLADHSSVTYTHRPLALASAILKACQAPGSSLRGPTAGLCVGGSRRGLLSLYPDLDRRIGMLVDLEESLRVAPILKATA